MHYEFFLKKKKKRNCNSVRTHLSLSSQYVKT